MVRSLPMRFVLMTLALAACATEPTVPAEQACADWALAHCECLAAQEALSAGQSGVDYQGWLDGCLADTAAQCAAPGAVDDAALLACLEEVQATTACLGDDPAESIQDRAARCGWNACFDSWPATTGSESACAWTGL